MASLACRSQPDRCLFDFRPAGKNARFYPTCSLAFSRDFSDRKRWRISAAATKPANGMGMMIRRHKKIFDDDDDNDNDRAIVHEKVDEWMKESVVEIVKNLREAPLLVQVYEGGETTTLKTEKAVEEETWPDVMEKWGKREVPLPEGVIFVDQLVEDGAGGGELREEDEITRAWGIVVQGKGEGCGPVCYLLKTSRVSPESGMGLCCTHFCLMKVKSFRESAMSQLKNCWLLQSQ